MQRNQGREVFSARFQEGAEATKNSPWYVVPADNKWFTRVVVGAAIVDTLASRSLAYPTVDKARLEEIAKERKALLESK